MPDFKPYQFHSEAWEEFQAADDWYLQRSIDASLGFLNDLDAAFEAICEAPQRWSSYLFGTRRFVMQRFPFSIVYRDTPDIVQLIAIAHGKRRPGYWKHRL
jgi:plasmid stabilization system protein ParE